MSSMKYRAPPKKKKLDDPSVNRPIDSPSEKRDAISMPNNKSCVGQSGIINMRNLAVSQAQQDGCTGNFRIFDSPYGNYLVPVIPTLADLAQ